MDEHLICCRLGKHDALVTPSECAERSKNPKISAVCHKKGCPWIDKRNAITSCNTVESEHEKEKTEIEKLMASREKITGPFNVAQFLAKEDERIPEAERAGRLADKAEDHRKRRKKIPKKQPHVVNVRRKNRIIFE